MRGLVLGNSHIAALKAAHRRDPGRISCTVDFAGGHGDTLASFTEDGGVFAAREPAARDNMMRLNGRLDYLVEDYDFFVITGCGLSVFNAIALYRGARHLGLPSMARAEAALKGADDPGWRLVSRANWDAALRAAILGTLGGRLVKRLAQAAERGGGGQKVIAVVQPRPSELCRAEPRRFAGFLRAEVSGDDAALAAGFEAAVQAALAPFATVLIQPGNTCAGALFTAVAYSAGSLRLAPEGEAVPHPPTDFLHANPDYGALVIDQIAAALSLRPAA